MAEYTVLAANPLRNIKSALKHSFRSPTSILQAVVSSGLLFVLLLVATQPQFSYEMFQAGPKYWGTALASLWELLLQTESSLGLFTVILYALLGGVTLQLIYTKIKTSSPDSVKGTLTFLPGALAAGCASCGAGVVGLVAGAGALSAIPFPAAYIRIAGICLFVYYLSLEGDPTRCAVPA